MKSLRQLLPIIALPLLLNACSTTYGVRRVAPLTGTLRLACVADAVRSAPGVSAVRMQPPDALEYQLRGSFGGGQLDQVWPTIYVREANSGAKSFGNSYEEKSYVPSQRELLAIHASMLGVEQAIFRNCIYAPSPAQITEKCTGVQC
jgi:hypothetical protein